MKIEGYFKKFMYKDPKIKNFRWGIFQGDSKSWLIIGGDMYNGWQYVGSQ